MIIEQQLSKLKGKKVNKEEKLENPVDANFEELDKIKKKERSTKKVKKVLKKEKERVSPDRKRAQFGKVDPEDTKRVELTHVPLWRSLLYVCCSARKPVLPRRT